MKKFSIFFSILFLSTFAFTQSNSQSSTQWRTYISPKDNFSVSTPKFVKELFFSVSEGGEEEVHRGGQYLTSQNDEYFNIFSLVIPKGAAKEVILPLPPTLKEFVESNSKNFDSKIVLGNPARQWIFKDNEGFCHKVLEVQTNTRVFVFQAIYENKDSQSVERFFNSIKFYPTLKTKSLQNKLKKSILINKLDKDKEAKDKILNGIYEPIVTIPKTSESSTTQLTSLKINSKPRAIYTDLARMYQISGDVILRVIFSADGHIGEITPVKKLPFGLTNSAINAAKQIAFEPAKKDNTPVTVTKQVKYTFTLY